jgi:microcystin-dependent protein
VTVPFERDLDPGDNFPSVLLDALQRMLTAGLASVPCPVRIKPGASNTLQVAAGGGQDAIGLVIDGAWRWNEAAAEQAGSGSAGDRDVWACTTASDYEAGTPGETDATDRSYVLRITAVDAAAPGGFAHTRRVARATWDGAQWTDVAPIVAGVVITPGQVGDVKATARSTAPIGWVLCDGSAVSRTTYAALFAAIGTTFGAGNGTTTFNLPDLRGRVPVGVDGSAGRLSANDALGQSGGEESHALTVSELASHDHNAHSSGYNVPGASSGGASWFIQNMGASGAGLNVLYTNGGVANTTKTGATGSGTAHNNMQPNLIVNWIIKV